ncbi:FAD-dependent monooxygenase [Streptomyces sp. NPDC059913]|uniref:FAD-dependent monooxygenase n=1 Tax=unclassified Streptomyces TaxID=2593676 RepID=UPI0036584A59
MRGEETAGAEVVVVGGGPVGMLLAAELAGYGVDTVLLESGGAVSDWPRATTLHARAVQVLARRGHLPGPVRAYRDGPGESPFHFAGLPGLAITTPANEPAPVLKCVQAELERHFEARAREAGARVLRGYRVTGVSQGADGVRVTAEGPHGTTVRTGRYAVGADGARSTVRDLVGLASDTHEATVSALAGTVTLARPDELAPGWHQTPRGWIVAKHTADGRTHLRTLNCSGAFAGRQATPVLEELRGEVSWLAGRDIGMGDPQWLSRFSDFSRVARDFRAGRVFLAGDAAHVHFPIGGQGLSAGVLDALNLGWKLALAVNGRAAAGLLDTYDAERRPAAGRIVEQTRAQLALMRPGPELDALREVFTAMLPADRAQGRLGAMISAQDTVLPGHEGPRGTGEFLSNLVLDTPDGETDVITLLRGGGPLLLLLGGESDGHAEEAREWEGAVRVVRARPVTPLPFDAVLVRPDGYAAWVPGGRALPDVLAQYLRQCSERGRGLPGPAEG